MAGLARPMHLAAGEVAYSAGDSPSRLIVVHTGHLKISRVSADGSEQLIRVLGPGEFVGEASVFADRSPEDYAIALDDCQACVFRHDDLRALVSRHPQIALRMLATVSARLSDTERRLSSLTAHDVEARVADYLLGLPGSWQGGIVTVTLPLAKKHVAALLDTTPESLSRSLRSLSDKGLIAIGPGRAVVLTQPDRLQQEAHRV
ncbi:Crp/Fnr family transcriptional regulator [Fodinibacter luteus]|uniref:Crp/Fnr family transcriptional regulator n=1 Tax=Fodinibacter luteus TaxID=552064 RepID=A0ABP8KJF2_9MICO